jgi:hypothetical protein
MATAKSDPLIKEVGSTSSFNVLGEVAASRSEMCRLKYKDVT